MELEQIAREAAAQTCGGTIEHNRQIILAALIKAQSAQPVRGTDSGLKEADVNAACPPKQKDGVALIAAERQRQITTERWLPEHDDLHSGAQLLLAAEGYADAASHQIMLEVEPGARPFNWPWHSDWWKPSDNPIRNLVKAGALIAAEIDRLLRKEPSVSDLCGSPATGASSLNPPVAQPVRQEEPERLSRLRKIAKQVAQSIQDQVVNKHLAVWVHATPIILEALENAAPVAPAATTVEGQNDLSFDFAPFKPPFAYDNQATRIVDSDNQWVLDVRGWGFLTGKGSEALGMDEEDAGAIQDAIGVHVTKLLNLASVPAAPESDSASGVSIQTVNDRTCVHHTDVQRAEAEFYDNGKDCPVCLRNASAAAMENQQ